MVVLKLTDIARSFGPTVALESVSLTLNKGQAHALIGENGAGKSTLINIIGGALKPDAGAMEVCGQPYSPSSPLDARLGGIAVIHQELSLAPHLSVLDNILMGIEPARWGWLDRRAARLKAMGVLESFHHPDIRPDRKVGDLSISARQVVEICRALAAQASIILMDEPTSSLQRGDADHLFRLIRRLKDQQISIIYISHFLEEVREVADTFTVLRDGRSVSSGSIDEITDQQLIAQMVGRPVENLFPARKPIESSELLFEARDLAAPPELKQVSFNIRRGEILGIAGLMGSGRTKMARAIMGLDRAESGTITLKSKAVSAASGTAAIRLLQGLGYLSEDRRGEGLALSLSVADNITLTQLSSCSRRGWLSLSRQKEQSEKRVRQLSIRALSPFQPVRALSGGNQQKVALARLLHQDADILLLDEPTRGIDIGSKAQIYEVISRCAADGKAVLMISSYLPELFGLCDRLAVMSRGRLSDARPIDQWSPESVMQAAIAGQEEQKRNEPG